MPRQADGTYTRDNSVFQGRTTWNQQANSGDPTIRSDRHDYHDNDLGDALTDSLSRSGSGGMQADLNMGNNKITNLAPGTAATDAPTLKQAASYTAPGTGAVERTIASVFNEYVRFIDYVPEAERAAVLDGTSTTNAYDWLKNADEEGRKTGRSVIFPGGGKVQTQTAFSHAQGKEAKTGWECRDGVFRMDVDDQDGDTRMWTLATRVDSSGTTDSVRPNQANDTNVPADAPLALLQPQKVYGSRVVLSNPGSDGSKFAAGDFVFVSANKDIFDANVKLWLFSMLTYIVEYDAGTGVAILADPIDHYLISDGWEPGGFRANAADWANGQTITVGDYRYDAADNANSLYKALTSGTTNGSELNLDTGVDWRWVCNDIETLKGSDSLDHRPVIQKCPAANLRANLTLRGFRIVNISSNNATMGVDLRQTYGCKVIDVSVEGRLRNGFTATESGNNNVFERIACKPYNISAQETCLRTYSARNTQVIDPRLEFAATSINDTAVYIEGNGDMRIQGGYISNIQPTEGQQEIGLFVSSGKLSTQGVRLTAFAQPVSMNNAFENLDAEDKTQNYLKMGYCREMEMDIAGNRFRARAWRYLIPAQTFAVFNDSNLYRVYETYKDSWDQKDEYVFNGLKTIEYTFSFTPSASQTNVIIPFPTTPQQGIQDMSNFYGVFIGYEVFWDGAVNDELININFKAKDKQSTTSRFLMGSNDTQNSVNVTGEQPRALHVDGSGGVQAFRNIDPDVEEISPRYTSTSGAGTGTVYITMYLLYSREGGDVRG